MFTSHCPEFSTPNPLQKPQVVSACHAKPLPQQLSTTPRTSQPSKEKKALPFCPLDFWQCSGEPWSPSSLGMCRPAKRKKVVWPSKTAHGSAVSISAFPLSCVVCMAVQARSCHTARHACAAVRAAQLRGNDAPPSLEFTTFGLAPYRTAL